MKQSVPLRHHAKHLAKGIAFGALIALIIIGGALLIFLAIWGWDRFKVDFWPLDSSRVGPNLCASVVIVVLVTGHNEYRTVIKDIEKGETVKQTIEEMEGEALHPVQAGEESVAQDVEEDVGNGQAAGHTSSG